MRPGFPIFLTMSPNSVHPKQLEILHFSQNDKSCGSSCWPDPLHTAVRFDFTSQATRHYNSRVRVPALHAAVLLACSALLPDCAFAGSATWNLNPISGDWNTADNWAPATVPNAIADIATFNVSNITNISVATAIYADSIVFGPGGSPYAITVIQGSFSSIGLFGEGVINNSGTTQRFNCVGNIGFLGNATAGNYLTYTNSGAIFQQIAFNEDSNAGSATFINEGDSLGTTAARIIFLGDSSAAESTIVNQAGKTVGADTTFYDSSTAANSRITIQTGADVRFSNNSTGGTATLIADGGLITFEDGSQGEFARVELVNGGLFFLGLHSQTVPLTIGSLEGDGVVQLSGKQLRIGGNGFSTTYEGLISGVGSLIKTGNETLTLTGANTYRGGTTDKWWYFVMRGCRRLTHGHRCSNSKWRDLWRDRECEWSTDNRQRHKRESFPCSGSERTGDTDHCQGVDSYEQRKLSVRAGTYGTSQSRPGRSQWRDHHPRSEVRPAHQRHSHTFFWHELHGHQQHRGDAD